MKRTLFTLVGGLLVLVLTAQGDAQSVPAEKQDEFEITPAAGPFAICAAAYTGRDAAERAHDLALEIRKTYSLPAYTFFKNRSEQEEQRDNLRKLRELTDKVEHPKLLGTRSEDQYAVLIGGYKDFDAASKATKELKELVRDDIKRTQTPQGGKITKAWLKFVTHVTTTRIENGKEIT